MSHWNSKKIREDAKINFEKTWEDTKKLIITPSKKKGKSTLKRGKPLKIYDTLFRLREAYLEMGFEEVLNPLFIEEVDVKKQFGPEANTVLDRVYYLGGLPRPDIGISKKKLKKISDLGFEADKEALERVLRKYKTGDIGGDDLVYEMANELGIDDNGALKIIDKVFPEIKGLKPKASNITLRSHMTSGWFLTLQSLYGTKDIPLKLFSIDRCFRREQKEDSGHLRTYFSASAVLLDDEIDLNSGKVIVQGLLKGFGFKDFRFEEDKKRSKYYSPDTQTEVFGLSPTGNWVEIATYGIYSPVALSRYGIEHPVMNLGVGVERLALVLSEKADIRELAYPQFYTGLMLSDEEIARGITFEIAPQTDIGKQIAESIVRMGHEHAEEPSPTSFEVYKGKINNRSVRVRIIEHEEGTRLLGPAALNEIIVYDGDIYGITENKGSEIVYENGTKAGITYLEALANQASAEIERASKDPRSKEVTIQIKGVKLPGEINLKIAELIVRFINSNNKKIDIRGPVFTTIEATFI